MNKIFFWLLLIGFFYLPVVAGAEANLPVGVPVLLYHKITPNPSELSKICCTLLTSEFEKQLNYLTKNGYQSINSDQLYDYLTKNASLPAKPVMLTFDDFHPSDYKIVLPLLLKHGFTGVFFIPSGYVQEGSDRLAGLLALDKAGMEIASHTVHHYFMARVVDRKTKPLVATLRPEVAKREIVESKKWFEKILNHEVNYLAWPGGVFTEELLSRAKEAGYRGIYLARDTWWPYLKTSRTGEQSSFNIFGLDQPEYIKRINVDTFLAFSDWQHIMEYGNLRKNRLYSIK